MRYAYLMIGTGVILVGLYEIVSGLSHRGSLFSGWGPGRAGDRLHGCTQRFEFRVWLCRARCPWRRSWS
jgi:hypothetical protein